MAHFVVRLSAPVSATEAWERVLDLHAHSEVIPFTTLRPLPHDREHGATGEVCTEGLPMSARDLMPGSRFVARTAWGRVGFDDPMVIEAMRAPQLTTPGFARIRKEGKAIQGWIDLSVAGQGSSAARVTWSQVILVRAVPRLLDPLVAAIARAAYGSALRHLLARH